MLNRRRIVQGGLAAVGSLSLAAPFDARAQGKPLATIRYNEVVRSLLYAPAYVALAKGYFNDARLNIAMTTAFGGDKSTAALLSNSRLFGDILPVIAEDPAADAFLVGIPVAGPGYDVDAFARDTAAVARQTGKPVVVAATQQSVAARFAEEGVSVFPGA